MTHGNSRCLPKRRQVPSPSLVFALLIWVLPGCTLLPHLPGSRRPDAQKKGAQISTAPQLVGSIMLVSADGDFVLIDNESRPSPATGTILRSQPADGPPAELRVTEIQRRPYVIADIVSGHPQKGDRVFR